MSTGHDVSKGQCMRGSVVSWREYDRNRKAETAPDIGELVWIREESYKPDQAELGYFNGSTFLTWFGSDVCDVTHWSPLTKPDSAEGTQPC